MAIQSIWRRAGHQKRSSDLKLNGTNLPSRRRRALLSKPRGVKCAQEATCFNKLIDAEGGHQECNDDGKDCEAFCLAGFTYNINEMKCKSVVLIARAEAEAGQAKPDTPVPAATKANAGLPDIPAAKPIVTTAAAKKLPEIPVADAKTSTTASPKGLPDIPKATETPVIPVARKKAVASTKKSASSSTFSSSSSSSSSSNSNSGKGSAGKDSAGAREVIKDEVIKDELPVDSPNSKSTTTTLSSSQSPSQKTVSTDPVKLTTETSTQADVQTTPQLPVGTKAATTSVLEVDAATTTPTQPVDTKETVELLTPTKIPEAITTEASAAQASAKVLQLQKIPDLSATESPLQKDTEPSAGGGDVDEILAPVDTSGKSEAEVSEAQSETSGERQDGGEATSPTGESQPAAPTAPADTDEGENVGSLTEERIIEGNNPEENNPEQNGIVEKNPQESPEEADNTEDDSRDTHHSEGKNTLESKMENNSADVKPSASTIASPSQVDSLASLDESLGSATAGITSKEKTAIAIGCAGVVIFIILVILALVNRNRLTKVLKGRSRFSSSSSSSTSGRHSLLSETSWIGADSEKLDQRYAAPSRPNVTGSDWSENARDTSRGQDLRTSHWSGSSSDEKEEFPQRQRQSAFAVSTHASERDNEELGYDWLEISSEGKANIISPKALLAQQQQSRFSSSPRKRSFAAQSIISSPGIIAKAFRIIVPEDKLKSTPALGNVPVSKKKGTFKAVLRLPAGLRSPPAKSPLGSAKRRQDENSLKESPAMTSATSSSDAKQTSTPPRMPPTPPKDAGNPFEDPAIDDNISAYYEQRYENQTPLPYAPAHLRPQVETQVLPRHPNPAPYHQRVVAHPPIEDAYIPATPPRSSVSQSVSEASQFSLALPGGRTPPMTPMTITRQPVSSLLSIPDSPSPYIDMHHSTQRTMDFRQTDPSQEEDYEETFPEDARDHNVREEEEEGYTVPEEVEYSRREEQSWYTRSSAAPPSLFDAVPITQEEIRKSRTRNTVRFADI